jgi:hypothetical protein
MGPPSYRQSVVDRNVIMRRIPVFHLLPKSMFFFYFSFGSMVGANFELIATALLRKLSPPRAAESFALFGCCAK